MEPFFEFGLEATRWLQSTFPQLQGFFKFISTLGIEEFYLIFLPLIYWSLHKDLGKRLAYLFLLANAVNALPKHLLRGPRPYWIDSSVGLDVESTYGIPSGHTEGATITYLFIASWFRKRWVWLLAILMVIVMGLSRIYLGVHFVHDVAVGFLIGLFVLIGYLIWHSRWSENFSKRILGYRLMIAFLVPIVVAVVYVVILLIIGEPDMSVAWSAFVEEAERESIDAITTAVASVLGAGLGLMFEGSRVRFRVEGDPWKRIARFVIGIVGAVAIWAGLRAVFPSDPLWVAIPLRFLRYTLLTLWVTYYAPWTFVKLGLAQADPEPSIDLKI
ncbi:MAG: phosphatase PAP2 family protein [Chloroflexi bacterium]|nr:phosphatase PAP2 family protein [Chloroflexota bacterium]